MARSGDRARTSYGNNTGDRRLGRTNVARYEHIDYGANCPKVRSNFGSFFVGDGSLSLSYVRTCEVTTSRCDAGTGIDWETTGMRVVGAEVGL